MPFVFWNVSEVTVDNFFVRQPPLWSLNIMNGTNMFVARCGIALLQHMVANWSVQVLQQYRMQRHLYEGTIWGELGPEY